METQLKEKTISFDIPVDANGEFYIQFCWKRKYNIDGEYVSFGQQTILTQRNLKIVGEAGFEKIANRYIKFE